MKKFIKRKLLFSEKESNGIVIGYARAIKSEVNVLDEQIQALQDYGCNMIFSEFSSVSQEIKPELNKALNTLSSGDQFVISSLDIVFPSKTEFIMKMNEFFRNGIYLKTLSGFFSLPSSSEIISSVFNILSEIDYLEKKNADERRKIITLNRSIGRDNLGGRPKISDLKEKLVIRLRNEGCSYRSIRSQTGLALSTIRRVILDSETK